MQTIAKQRSDYPADVLCASATPPTFQPPLIQPRWQTLPRATHLFRKSFTARSFSLTIAGRPSLVRLLVRRLTRCRPAPRFDAKNITPRFEFGFGLSYTTFSYSELHVKSASSKSSRNWIEPRWNGPGGTIELYDPAYTVSFKVTNTGSYDGNEVSQLYLEFPTSAGEPPKVLRGELPRLVSCAPLTSIAFRKASSVHI